ncbi:MAG TPA: response regulator transcription factor [Candidatus Polarisedimenticolia bacterium]|nr:response regulator transcription factor [Candidatus Polarisedimenticolia bacterium]
MKKTSPIRILICDDHFIVRMGLTAMINAETDMEIVGEATDGGEAVAMFARFKPDVMLLDIRMPVVNGVDVATTIRKQNKNARILILSALNGDEDIHKALEAGVAGYVLKDATEESLIPAIRAVAAGERWIPQDVASRLAARNSFEELTSRELQVLNKLIKGMANKQIADALNISENTVKGFLKNILAKLRVDDRTEAVAVAIQRGIIHF